MRRADLVATVVLAAVVGTMALPATEAAAPPGKVVVALGSDVPTLDPHMHAARMGIIVDWHLYDDLFARDPQTMAPVPHLAESLKAIDPVTWELRLRKGVRFHNGEPFTAESVRFSLERIIDPQQKSPIRGTFAWLKSVEVVSESTVRLHTQKPYPLVAELLAYGNAQMVPPKYVKQVGDAQFEKAPVGTGPFRFVEWKKGQHLILEANEQYWKGAPAVKTIVFRTIPETATQIAELLSGGVHIIRAVPPDQIPVIQGSAEVRVSTAKGLRVVYLQIDTFGRASQTPLTDRRVRLAVAHAVNVDEIMQKILGGMAYRTPGWVSDLQFGYDPTIKPIAFEPALSRRLLAEAGYPNGFEVPLITYGGSVVSVDQVADAVQGYLAAVGVRVKRRHIADVGLYLKTQREGKADGLVLASWGSGSTFDADALFYPLARSGEPLSYIKDPETDAWVDQARSTLDAKARRELYSKAQRRIVEQAYVVPMYGQFVIEAANRKLEYEASPDEIMHVYRARWKE